MLNILIVEDQADVRAFLAVVLTRAGFLVREAADGGQGIACLREALPDLVITDIFMPVNDGLEVIRAARKLNANLPIVAISGGTPMIGRDYLPVAESFGATATLMKPITPHDLLAVVRQSLAEATPVNQVRC
ncbi:MAG TPA: response regulator [Dongiaceae bacterium]|nr:response regulator [Dongiaceae bacterium]